MRVELVLSVAEQRIGGSGGGRVSSFFTLTVDPGPLREHHRLLLVLTVCVIGRCSSPRPSPHSPSLLEDHPRRSRATNLPPAHHDLFAVTDGFPAPVPLEVPSHLPSPQALSWTAWYRRYSRAWTCWTATWTICSPVATSPLPRGRSRCSVSRGS